MKERPIVFSGPMVNAILAGRKTQTRRVMKPQPPNGYVSMVRDCDCGGNWWFSNMPPQRGAFSVGEHAKWGNVFPRCPYGIPGQKLWVRESWLKLDWDHRHDVSKPNDWLVPWGDKPRRNGCAYKADATSESERCRLELGYKKWTPSIHMPRWASRITLEIISVGVERLQDISEEDARAEGVSLDFDYPVEGLACPRCRGQGLHQCFGENYGISETECKLCDTAKKRFAILWDRINAKRAPWESNPWVWVLEFKRVEA